MESLILEIQTILETKYNLLKTCESFLSEKSMSEPEVLMEALEAEIKAIRIQDLLFLSRYEQILNQFGVSTLEELPESVRLEMQNIQRTVASIMPLEAAVSESFETLKSEKITQQNHARVHSKLKTAYAKKTLK